MKRFILSILMFVLLIGVLSADAFADAEGMSAEESSVVMMYSSAGDVAKPILTADGKTVTQVEKFEEIYLNPLFPHEEGEGQTQVELPAFISGGTLRAAARFASAAINTNESMSYDESIPALRSAFVNRTTSVSVLINCGAGSLPPKEQILEDIVEHTGVPEEGDYLQFHYASFGFSGSIYTIGGDRYYDLMFKLAYYTNAEQENVVASLISDALAQMDLGDASKTDYDRFLQIYEYIDDTVTYDYDTLNDNSYDLKYTAYAAISNGTAVCQGYANLLYRMCLTVGIEARIVSGEVGGTGHAWNIVKVGNAFYVADATWDDSHGNYDYSNCLVSDADCEHPGCMDDRSVSICNSCGLSGESFPCSPYTSGVTFNAHTEPLHEYEIGSDEVICTKCGVSRSISALAVVLDPDFVLPAGLTRIEESAFENCAFHCVEVPNFVENIDGRAFADCELLQSVLFRNETVEIDGDAFAESTGVVFCCPQDSTAKAYALEHQIPYYILPMN
ncbi:MAG: leucine-rich repeat protein [Oscillospiraceae bacterium]|nr:leucine-rich repeat protein [Oscillospiraceae bacterium]